MASAEQNLIGLAPTICYSEFKLRGPMTISAIELWDHPAVVCRGPVLIRTNEPFCRLLAVSDQDTFNGQQITSLLTEATRDAVRDVLNNGLPDGTVTMSACLQRADGSQQPASFTVIEGNPAGDGEWTALVTEQSGGGLFPPGLFESPPDEAHNQRMVEFSELTVSLLHDLGQSITAVQAAGEMVQVGVESMEVPEDFRKLVGIIARAGQELSQRHSVIRNFARHRQASYRLQSLAELVDEAASLVIGKAQAERIRVEVVTDTSLLPVKLDSGLIHLALISLMTRTIRLLSLSTVASDRRLLIRHTSTDGDRQEVSLEYQRPAVDVSINPERFATAKRVSELHGGRLLIETPAPDVIRCRMIVH